MSDVVLTPAQSKFLLDCWRMGASRAKETQPVTALAAAGLIEARGPMVNWHKTWVVTDQGRSIAEKKAARRRRRKRC